MKDVYKKNSKKAIELSLPEESWEQLQALANGQQKQLESVVEEAVKAYLQPRTEESKEDKINPIEDTTPARSWGYNSDVRGK